VAGLNLKYSRRVEALVLKVGKRDEVDFNLLARIRAVGDAALIVPRSGEEDEVAGVFYYGVSGLVPLDSYLGATLSGVQYRTLLRSLRDVMALCVREGLPQGNVCFTPSRVRVDSLGRMRFAFIPFSRVEGAGAPLELLAYLGQRRRVRLVLEEDDAARRAVEDFARRSSVLALKDFDSFLATSFGMTASPADGCGSPGGAPFAGHFPSGALTRAAAGASGAPDEGAPLDGGALTVDPVAMFVGKPAPRPVARAVAEGVGSGPFAAAAHEEPRFVLKRLSDGSRYALPSPSAVVGRSERCDVTLPGNASMSRQHIRVELPGPYLVDLGSANGTFVDGVRLAPHRPYRIAEGQEFRLADELFSICADSYGADPSATARSV